MVELHATVIGKGKPFLILHGFLGMGDNWKTLGTKFSKLDYQVHLLDMRNHGRSAHTDDFNYEIMAQDVFNYCKLNHLEDIVLLGHSMGGKAAMYLACEYSYLVEKLIIVDIAPKYYKPHHQKILEGLTVVENETLTSRGEAEDLLAKYIDDEGTKLFLLKNLYWKTKEKLALRLNLEALKNNIEEVGKSLPESFVFEKETLFIKGEKSNYITNDDKSLIESHFPAYSLIEIANAGHWVHAENMDSFYGSVVDFL